jgi:hypothetical protein
MFSDYRNKTCQAFIVGPAEVLATLVTTLLSSCCPPNATPGPESVLTQTQQSAHFVFHYAPGDRIDVPRTEAFYTWISWQLSVDLGTRIQYFKFKDKQQKQSLTGLRGNANADPSLDTVYTIWPWETHEITHLLTARIGYPTDFFNEGIAVANQVDPLDDSYTPLWNSNSVHRCANDFLAAGALPSLASIVETTAFRAADPDITYPTAGSFVEYLIEQNGMQQVLQLFPGVSWQDSLAAAGARFQQVFGISLEQAEQAWHAVLQQYTR